MVISTDSSDVPSAETTLALVLLYIILTATGSLGGMPCAFRILSISFRWIESTAFLKSKNVIIAERLFFRASSRMRRKERGSTPSKSILIKSEVGFDGCTNPVQYHLTVDLGYDSS